MIIYHVDLTLKSMTRKYCLFHVWINDEKPWGRVLQSLLMMHFRTVTMSENGNDCKNSSGDWLQQKQEPSQAEREQLRSNPHSFQDHRQTLKMAI